MPIESSEKYRRHRHYFVDLSRFYQKKQVRVYTGLVFSLITIVFFLIFAIRPTLVTITGLIKEIKDKKEVTEKLENKISQLTSAQAEYQQIQKELYLVDEALPVNANFPLLALQLEALARKDALKIGSLQYEKIALRTEGLKAANIKDKGDLHKIIPGVGFNLSVSGDYSQLKTFIGNLLSLRRSILLDDYSIQSKSKEKVLTLTLKGRAVWLEPESEAIQSQTSKE